MDIQTLFDECIKNKFIRGYISKPLGLFQYEKNCYNQKELFILNKDDSFLAWDMNFTPADPHYTEDPDAPILCKQYPMIDVYDQLTLGHLLYTINSVTFAEKPNEYSAINVFMKHYCFFQLSQLPQLFARGVIDNHHYPSLKQLFWFYFLYTHPVNEDTLYSCHFESGKLIYTAKNIVLSDYFAAYYDYFINQYDKLKEKLNLQVSELESCKTLTSALLKNIEGKGVALIYYGDNKILPYINDVSLFLTHYTQDKEGLFECISHFARKKLNKYDDFLLSVILQNYVCYILRNDFKQIEWLSRFLASKANQKLSSLIINKIFSDTIFAKRFFKEQKIDIPAFTYIVSFFDDESKRINLD